MNPIESNNYSHILYVSSIIFSDTSIENPLMILLIEKVNDLTK